MLVGNDVEREREREKQGKVGRAVGVKAQARVYARRNPPKPGKSYPLSNAAVEPADHHPRFSLFPLLWPGYECTLFS